MSIRSRRELSPVERRTVAVEEWLRIPKKAIKLAFWDLAFTGGLLASEISWLLVPYLVWMFLTQAWIVLVESSARQWPVDSLHIADYLWTLRTVIVLTVIHVAIVASFLYMYFDLKGH